MELLTDKKTIIFIEESVLLEKAFVTDLREIVEKKDKSDVTLLFDNDISNASTKLKGNNKIVEANLLDGLIDIIKLYGLYNEIETNSYLDSSNIIKKMTSKKNTKNYIITQKESVYNSMKAIKSNVTVEILKYESNKLIKWQEKIQNLNAFYLEKDEEYIYKVDTTNINYVYSPKYGYLKLDLSSVKSGGEGSVYRTYSNHMAKIYNQNNITYVNYKKISQMIDMNVFNPFICWPKDLLYYNNHFVGYLMNEIVDATPLLSLRLSNFKQFTHLERFELCYNLLKQIKYLHDKNIIIGDLKPDNILVKGNKEIYFIDCGCYQIEDYACPVCHPEYTKRVFKKDELKKELRTIQDEYYPINKLAFEILVRKNHTYSPDNLDIESQDKKQFYYPLDVSNVKPKTEDMAIWCFMTQAMREYFYYYFKEERITDLSTWCNELKIFIETVKKMNK